MKKCTRCGKTQPPSEFYNDRQKKDGLSSHCKTCDNARSREYYAKNSEGVKARVKQYDEENRERKLEYLREYGAKRRKEQPEKEKARHKQYYEDNQYRFRAQCAKYRAAKKRQTPAWADHEAICEFYKNCPEGFHVDHIYPINGKTVSGLHVLKNLQYLPAEENLRKGNKYEN